MNKLIKWVTDIYYNNQRKPEEPEITYQEPIAEPVEEKNPLEEYQIMYYRNNIYYSNYYYHNEYCVFTTTDYKVFKMDKSKQIKELSIGIPVISLMKYIDKMFAKMEVTCERIEDLNFYQVGEYRFNKSNSGPLSEVSKTIKLSEYENSIINQCVYWNITEYEKLMDKRTRQAMEDKLQGLLKDLE